jgi:hypothetical protein
MATTMATQNEALHRKYYPILRSFFMWKDKDKNIVYDTDHTFLPNDLARITPEDVVQWFNLLAYGTETPGPEDRPDKRSTGLAFNKKAISYYIVDNSVPWNSQAKIGNPTMSKMVNKCIALVRKHECRHEGKVSNAKRDLKRSEFKLTLELLQNDRSFLYKHKIPTMLKLQFHIIARTDDICNMMMRDIREHEKYGEFALQTKVAWSKNVTDERQCPDQIILGCNDPDFCVLMSLAGYMEARFTDNLGDATYLFGDRNDPEEPKRMNNNYGNALRKQWKKPAFAEALELERGSIGTHSIRKFAATWAAEHGCTPYQVEIRGRWKANHGSGRVVNLYINSNQLPTDGKVASILCVGQPVRYKLKVNSGITRHWWLTNVVPGIQDHFNVDPRNKIADVLALPLLYACLEPGLEFLTTARVRSRVQNAWALLRGAHEIGWNPVEKVILQVYQYENSLVISEMVTVSGGATDSRNDDAISYVNREHGYQERLNILTNQMYEMKQEMLQGKMETQHMMGEFRGYCTQQFTHLHCTLGKLLHQAPTRRAPDGNRPDNHAKAVLVGRQSTALKAGLSKCPRNLHFLWREWTDGLEGNKPASKLKVSERGGKLRYIYHNRLHVWKVIKRFTDKNVSHLTAIEAIEAAYGENKSVTYYIQCLKRDKIKNTPHPSLNCM